MHPRLHFLDTLRVLAFGLLVAYHVGMYYVSWDWHVKSAFASTALEPWMRLSAPWRMSLLFLISGAATGWLLREQDRSLRERLGRLLKPLLLGVVLIVPPQSWLEVVHKLGYAEGYLAFLRLYFSGYGGFCGKPGECLILPTWNHLWFLPYLALYTTLAWFTLRRWPALLRRLEAGAAWLAASRGLLVLPLLLLVLARLVLLPTFPPTHALVGDWYQHAQFAPLFLLGLLWAQQRGSWLALARWRHLALVLALLAWAVSVGSANIDGQPLPLLLRRTLGATMQWFGLLAVVGFAVRHLDRPLPWVRRCADAVFPLYLVHQTLIILAAHCLAPLALRPLVEGPVLLVLTFGGGWAFYRVVRRIGWLRSWCGLAAVQPPPRPSPLQGEGGQAQRAEASSIEARKPA